MADDSGLKLTSLHLLPLDITNDDSSVLGSITIADAPGTSVLLTITLDHSLVDQGYIGHGVSFTSPIDSIRASSVAANDGTAMLNGFYSLIDTSTKKGDYTITSATISDSSGYAVSYSTADLIAQGFDTVLTVIGDTMPPSLNTLIVGTGDDQNSDNVGTLSVNATETGSDRPYLFAIVNTDHPVVGDRNGIYFNTSVQKVLFGPTQTINSGITAVTHMMSVPGSGADYNITSLDLFDLSGNETHYSADVLKGLGFATSFSLPAPALEDFDGNHVSDIVWQNVDGRLSTWSAASGSKADVITQDTSDARADTPWHVVDTFDWNNDGRADLVWRNYDGSMSIWNGTSRGFAEGTYTAFSIPTSWSIVGAGDLNGDGRGDLLWRNQDGSLSTWLSTGTDFQQNAYSHAPVATSWKVEGVGDFNGDGRADILWRNDDGSVSTWNSNGSGFDEASTLHAPVGADWHIVGIGDFNGDGRADILWHNDDGDVTAWLASPTGFQEGQLNASAPQGWSVAQVGDFNGDGRADILWRNDSGAISIWHATSTGWDQNSYFDNSVGTDWAVSGHHFPS